MNGISGLLPFGEVAAGVAAIRRSNLQIVIVVEMAGGARNIGVAIGEQEARGAVVERSAVFQLTVLWQVAQLEAAKAGPAEG